MDSTLREQFDRAVGDDPGADPGEMASAAIALGGRVRRRRRQLAAAGAAAGLVLVLAVVAVVNVRPPATAPGNPPASANPPSAAAPAMVLVAATGCSPQPVERDATDAVVLPGDAAGHVTDPQLAALRSALEHDARVKTVIFDSRESAYQRFRKLWAADPDFVGSVDPEQLPESFRLRLVDASQYAAFRADYEAMDTVQYVEGRVCPVSAPVGGVR